MRVILIIFLAILLTSCVSSQKDSLFFIEVTWYNKAGMFKKHLYLDGNGLGYVRSESNDDRIDYKEINKLLDKKSRYWQGMSPDNKEYLFEELSNNIYYYKSFTVDHDNIENLKKSIGSTDFFDLTDIHFQQILEEKKKVYEKNGIQTLIQDGRGYEIEIFDSNRMNRLTLSNMYSKRFAVIFKMLMDSNREIKEELQEPYDWLLKENKYK